MAKITLEIEVDENEVLKVINNGENGDNSAGVALMWLISDNLEGGRWN